MRPAPLLLATAGIEFGAGLVLLLAPATLMALLLGGRSAAPETLLIARVAGAALLALGAGCWWACRDSQSLAAVGVVAAALVYNLLVVAILAAGMVNPEFRGLAFALVIAVHSFMAVWCLMCLRGRGKPRAENERN